MSNPVTDAVSFPRAAVLYANWLQFGPGERDQHSRVESRMLLWCKAGSARVRANGTSHDLVRGRFLLLPWGHEIQYESAHRDPAMLAGIHVIPDHALDRPLEPGVIAHGPDSPVSRVAWRADVAVPGLSTVISGEFRDQPALERLAEYILDVYTRTPPQESTLRLLGQVLMLEYADLVRPGVVRQPGIPGELIRVVRFVQAHLGRPLGIEEIVEFSNLSAATLNRLFRRHLGASPHQWILRQRVERAAEFLRTSRMPISAVAEQTGFCDQFYFSKCFKREFGVNPLHYRKTAGVL